MKRFTITIPITPVPKARPRFTITRTGRTNKTSTKSKLRVHTYTPKTTADYEKAIAEYWRQATHNFQYDREQALIVNLVFGMPIPKSTSKSKTELMNAGIIPHIKKADIDNLAKAVLDSLNRVAWVDDSQVVRLSISKKYAKEPYVYIYIHDDAE